MRIITILPLVLIGCAGDTVEDTPVDPTDTLEVAWPDMDAGERAAYMNDVVLPDMRAEFEAFDASYATMDCATCHGTGASGDFAMPSADLPAIDLAAFPTGPGADFMTDVVVPMMTELLDAEPFDTSDGSGFGCLSCHPAATM